MTRFTITPLRSIRQSYDIFGVPESYLIDRGADDPLHDHAVAIDQIALRYAEDVVRLPDRATGIVQDVEGEAETVREAQDLGRAGRFLVRIERVAVDAHRGDPEVGARELLVQLFHRGHLGAAGRAPRRPDIEQHDFAAVVGERGRTARMQIGGVEL